MRTGPAIDNTLLSAPGYNAVGDPYIQPSGTANARPARQKDSWKKTGYHDFNFKPVNKVSTYKNVPTTSYKYICTAPLNADPKRCRHPEEGYVMTKPRNLYSAAPRSGAIASWKVEPGSTFLVNPSHVAGDDLTNAKMLREQERAYHYSKL